MDCGGVFAKYVLFTFNILFVVSGILLIIFGSLMLFQLGDIENVSETFMTNSVTWAIIVVGVIMFIVAFLGCRGAIRENTCCTTWYAVFMLILFICQVVIIIFVWTERAEFLKQVDVAVSKIWEQRKSDQKLMDVLQLSFKCCGKNNFADYVTALEDIPNSCCGAEATSCNSLKVITRPGCSRALTSFWGKNMDVVRYAGLGVAAIELIALIFACCLTNQVRNNRRRGMY